MVTTAYFAIKILFPPRYLNMSISFFFKFCASEISEILRDVLVPFCQQLLPVLTGAVKVFNKFTCFYLTVIVSLIDNNIR